MAYTWDLLFDPSAFILISCAAITIFLGAKRSLAFYKTQFDGTTAIGQVMEEASGNELKLATAIILPIFGSVVLLALFYFLNWLQYLLLAIFTIASFIGVLSAFNPLYEMGVKAFKLPPTITPLKFIGWHEPFSTAVVAGVPMALAAVIVWLVWPYFLLTDALALCLGISAMMFLRIPSLKIATVVLLLFFFYDVFWVFISPYIFGDNVMVKVATSMPKLPIVILVPRMRLEGYSLLGMGDITLPGLFLCFLHRFDDYKHPEVAARWWGFSGYFRVGLISYTFGLIWTFVMLIALQMPQPALLYLVPSILITNVLLGWYKGELKALWEGFGFLTSPSVPDAVDAVSADNLDAETAEAMELGQVGQTDGYKVVATEESGESSLEGVYTIADEEEAKED